MMTTRMRLRGVRLKALKICSLGGKIFLPCKRTSDCIDHGNFTTHFVPTSCFRTHFRTLPAKSHFFVERPNQFELHRCTKLLLKICIINSSEGSSKTYTELATKNFEERKKRVPVLFRQQMLFSGSQSQHMVLQSCATTAKTMYCDR